MKITKDNLESFRTWLLNRGRAEGTAELYVQKLRKCADERSITSLLVGGERAPLTRRTYKAAIVQWAKFTMQPELAEAAREIRLPPARRVAVKLPFAEKDWQALVEGLASVKYTPVRCACLIIAKRGLRISDALRIKRTEVVEALKTGKLSYVGKGEKRHVVSAAPVREQLEILADKKGWERIRDLVAPGRKNAASAARVRRAFKRSALKLEVDNVYPHRFRRTYATTFLKALAGDPQALIKLQNHMGWSDLATAAMYADAVDADALSDVGDAMSERLFAKKAP